jgi:hypothetical protein
MFKLKFTLIKEATVSLLAVHSWEKMYNAKFAYLMRIMHSNYVIRGLRSTYPAIHQSSYLRELRSVLRKELFNPFLV